MTSRLDGRDWQVLTDAIIAGGHTSPVGLPTVWNVDDNRMASGGIKHVPLICECAKDLRSGEPLDNHHRTREHFGQDQLLLGEPVFLISGRFAGTASPISFWQSAIL